jgi:succinoglycan biosynthesis transport protein ExoP
MLKNSKQWPGAGRQQSVPEVSLIDLASSLTRIVRRQLAVIIISIIAGSSLGVAYILVTPKSYTAKAQLITDTRRLQISPSLAEAPIEPWAADTQVEILKSEKILLPVINNLQLLENPEFNRSGFFSTFFRSQNRSSDLERTRGVLQAIQDSLEVARVVKTQIVEISFKSRDPDLAARIVNAIADSFILDQLDSRAQAARRASVWLQDRIKELGDEASSAERAVVEFKAKNNIVDAGGKLMGEQQVAEVNTKLIAARSDMSEAIAKLSRIETILGSAKRDAAVDATVADTLKSSVVTKLRDHYLELAGRVADYEFRFGPNHLSVVRMRSQMQEIRKSIRDELQRLAETYKSDLEISKRKEEEIQRELDQTVAKSQATGQAQVTLRELESSARSYRMLYNNFIERNAEQVQQQSMRLSDARLISPASPPLKPSHPKTLMALTAATFAGAVLGFGVVAFREMADRVFRTADQVENLLRMRCIALAPKLKAGAAGSPTEEEDAGDTSAAEMRGLAGCAKGEGAHVSQGAGSSSDESLSGAAPAAEKGEALVAERARGESSPIHESGVALAMAEGEANAATQGGKTSLLEKSNDSSPDEERTEVLEESKSVEAKVIGKVISNSKGPATAGIDAPFSRFGEAIQSIKLAVDLDRPRNSTTVIGITSSLPGEGKSTISINLARLIARTGSPTVLLDCDLRVSRLTNVLAPSAVLGLREVLAGGAPLDDAMWKDELSTLMFLPAGGAPNSKHPTELLTSDAAASLFETLRETYRWVIVDLPPIGPVMDAHATSHFIDSYLLVIEWGQTKFATVKRALSSTSAISDRLLGAILNKVDVDQLPNYDDYYGDLY